MQIPDFRGDCQNCLGLCCMAFAFDASDMFAYDKPAGQPCRHLTGDYGCAIHDQRVAKGFAGCLKYDCLGAGQRISQTVFAGKSWRDSDETRRQIIDAFRALRQVHRLLELVLVAGKLPLDAEQRAEHGVLLDNLMPEEDWTAATLALFEDGPIPARVHRFLAGLSALVRNAAPGGPA